jgi:hypothetical protein
MDGHLKLSFPAFDRRRFIGAGLSLSVLPASSLVPHGQASAAVSGPELVHDWTIDDQWIGYPRYNEAIGYGRQQPFVRPKVHPADDMLIEL